MSGFELRLRPFVAAGEALQHVRLDGARAHYVDTYTLAAHSIAAARVIAMTPPLLAA
jgi:hypothetical protein